MKKIILLIIFASLFLVGCENTDKTKKYKEIMREYGETYYNTYSKPYLTPGDADKFEVTIEALRNANSNNGADFNLGSLAKCSSASKVTLLLDQAGNVADYEYYFECE